MKIDTIIRESGYAIGYISWLVLHWIISAGLNTNQTHQINHNIYQYLGPLHQCGLPIALRLRREFEDNIFRKFLDEILPYIGFYRHYYSLRSRSTLLPLNLLLVSDPGDLLLYLALFLMKEGTNFYLLKQVVSALCIINSSDISVAFSSKRLPGLRDLL